MKEVNPNCRCKKIGARTCPVHPNRAGDGVENPTNGLHCECQVKGAQRCPMHPNRGATASSAFGKGNAGRRLAILIDRDGPLCYYCGVDLLDYEHVIATTDHKTPKGHGGSGLLSNLVACCYVCNHAKSDRTEAIFRKSISEGKLQKRIASAQREVERRLERRRLGIDLGGN